ncbi:MAG: hypothetical protein ACTS3R_07335 [Inquilinaceae bacterium]
MAQVFQKNSRRDRRLLTERLYVLLDEHRFRCLDCSLGGMSLLDPARFMRGRRLGEAVAGKMGVIGDQNLHRFSAIIHRIEPRKSLFAIRFVGLSDECFDFLESAITGHTRV